MTVRRLQRSDGGHRLENEPVLSTRVRIQLDRWPCPVFAQTDARVGCPSWIPEQCRLTTSLRPFRVPRANFSLSISHPVLHIPQLIVHHPIILSCHRYNLKKMSTITLPQGFPIVGLGVVAATFLNVSSSACAAVASITRLGFSDDDAEMG
jgi:hypothetical protein